MNIFSVTAFIFLTHSLSLTTGICASRTLSGIGPAKMIELFIVIVNHSQVLLKTYIPIGVYDTSFSYFLPCIHIQSLYIFFRHFAQYLGEEDIQDKLRVSSLPHHEVLRSRCRYPAFVSYGCDECRL